MVWYGGSSSRVVHTYIDPYKNFCDALHSACLKLERVRTGLDRTGRQGQGRAEQSRVAVDREREGKGRL